MNTENNNAHLALHGIVAVLAFCLVVAVFSHVGPHHTNSAAAITAPADCLPSGSGGLCIPFDQIQKMMLAQPDASDPVPANPATAHEEKI